MAGDDGLVPVQLLGLPVPARSRFSQHLQELTRELSLIQIGAQHRPEGVLPRLLQLAGELNGTYAAFRAEPDAAVQAALAAGEEFCDVTYLVPPSAGPFLRRLGEVLDEADEVCRNRTHLLSLPASQEVVAYRRWFIAEAARQLAGEPARPWRYASPPEGVVAPVLRIELPSVPDSTTGVGGTGPLLRPPLVLESLAGNVSAARRYVREVLRELGSTDLEEAAELGVSELVTNAVLHARTAFTLSVRSAAGGRVRIEVGDSSGTSVQPRQFAETSTTGRGLRLVASLSYDWGVEHQPPERGAGKTVWFEPRGLDVEASTADHDWTADLDALT